MCTDEVNSCPKRASLLPNLAVLIFLGPLCGLLATCKKPELPLNVRVAGCDLLGLQASRTVCAADDLNHRFLVFAIDGPPLARLHFRMGDTDHEQVMLSASGHASFMRPYPTIATQVTLRAESSKGTAEYTLAVQPTIPFDKAKKRCNDLHCLGSAKQCLETAQTILTGLDATPRQFDADEQAFLLGMLGKRIGAAAQQQAQADDAQALRQLALSVLERTMAEARATGLLSVEARALERLGMAMRSPNGEYDRHLVAAKLGDPIHQRALDQCPEQSGNVKYTLSWTELEQGHLATAKLLANESATIREEFSLEPHVQIGARLLEALVAQSLQQTAEAERIVSQVEKQLAARFLINPCELAKQYNLIAWIKLLALQSGHALGEPDTSFTQVDERLQLCKKQSKENEAAEVRGVLSTNRALYAMFRAEQAAFGSRERLDQLARAETMTEQAREEQKAAGRLEQTVVQQDLASLGARVALLRGQGQDALQAFVQLERLTARWLSPHYRWESQIGQADAHLLLGETAAALTAHARAETLLDRMAAELPMTTGHQRFLAQFEAGTGRYLKLLLANPAAADKVLEVIRRARARALQTYARGPGAGRGQSWTAEHLEQYWTLLGKREATQAKLLAAPLADEETVRSELQKLRSEQAELLEELYAGPPTDSTQLALRPPAPDELLIACYPLPREPGEPLSPWVCAGASAGRIQVLRIVASTEATPNQAAQAILAGFGETLRQVKHLRILAYGALRAVPWASLPWAGGRLADHLLISYGVDPPERGGHTSLWSHRALLVYNPQQDLPSAQRIGERLRKELPTAGWQLDARAGAPRRGGQLWELLAHPLRARQQSPALAKEVVNSLPSIDLFVYYGHAESLGPGGWDSRLRLAEDGSISARDIMSMTAVPRKVFLIGCETAVSDEQAPADEGGLAQSFILRGSKEVLATTRKVAEGTAEALVNKLAQLGALRPDGPPLAAALRDAVTALRPQHPEPDLDYFRVYTP